MTVHLFISKTLYDSTNIQEIMPLKNYNMILVEIRRITSFTSICRDAQFETPYVLISDLIDEDLFILKLKGSIIRVADSSITSVVVYPDGKRYFHHINNYALMLAIEHRDALNA